MIDTSALAERLDQAAQSARATSQLSVDITVEQAYEIQRLSIARRLSRGERRIGTKMGFTSRAKMVQMGVSDLIWGRLTDLMLQEEGGDVRIANFIHPRVEPEIVYLLKQPLAGRVTAMQAFAAVEAVAPALEIIDSRYENFKFSLTDVIADNSSSSGLVIGGWQPRDSDVTNLGIVLSVDGYPKAFGSTAAILGNPIRSLVAAARMAEEAGEELQPGWIVMAGGATAALALERGSRIQLEVENLGRAAFSVQ